MDEVKGMGIMMKRILTLIFGLLTLAFVSTFAPIASQQGNQITVPKLKMLWKTTVDAVQKQYPDTLYEESDGDIFVSTKNSVYYIKAGQLVSSRLQDGHVIWKTGKDVNGVLSLFDGQIIARVGKYTVQAFSATTGKIVWQKKLPKVDIEYVTVLGDACFVVQSQGSIALDAHKGGERFRFQNTIRGYGPVAVYKDIVIWHWLSTGAAQQDIYVGFSIKTGKQIWVIAGPLVKVEFPNIYVNDPILHLDDSSITLRQVNIENGEISSQTYDISNLVEKPFGGMGIGLYIDSESVWAQALDAKGWFIARFDRNDLSKLPERFDLPEKANVNQFKFSGTGFGIYSPTGAVIGIPPREQKGLIYKNSTNPITKISVFGRWMVVIRESAPIYSPTPKFKADRKGALQVVDLENGNIVAEAFPNLGDSITLQMQDRLLLLRSGPELTAWAF